MKKENKISLFKGTINAIMFDDLIEMNKILKRNITDEENPRYNVVGFKVVPNKIYLINVIDTSSLKDV